MDKCHNPNTGSGFKYQVCISNLTEQKTCFVTFFYKILVYENVSYYNSEVLALATHALPNFCEALSASQYG